VRIARFARASIDSPAERQGVGFPDFLRSTRARARVTTVMAPPMAPMQHLRMRRPQLATTLRLPPCELYHGVQATRTVAAAAKTRSSPLRSFSHLDPACRFNLGGRAVNLTVDANFGSDGTHPSCENAAGFLD
jgi:hypothetical protein